MALYGDVISSVLNQYQESFQQHTDLEYILSCLKREGLIEDDEYEEQRKQKEGKEKNLTLFLFNKIRRGGDKAFPALLKCLKKKYLSLAKSLLQSVGEKNEKYAKELRIRKNSLLSPFFSHCIVLPFRNASSRDEDVCFVK